MVTTVSTFLFALRANTRQAFARRSSSTSGRTQQEQPINSKKLFSNAEARRALKSASVDLHPPALPIAIPPPPAITKSLFHRIKARLGELWRACSLVRTNRNPQPNHPSIPKDSTPDHLGPNRQLLPAEDSVSFEVVEPPELGPSTPTPSTAIACSSIRQQ